MPVGGQELGNDFVCSVDVTRINIAHVCHAHKRPPGMPSLSLSLSSLSLLPLLVLMHWSAVAYYRNCICHKTAAPTSWSALPCLLLAPPSSPWPATPTCRLRTASSIHFLVYFLYSIAALSLFLLRLLRGLLRRKVFATNLLR